MKKELITYVHRDIDGYNDDNISEEVIYLRDTSEGKTEKIQIDQLSQYDDCLFVTFQPDDLISKMSENTVRRNHFIDIECMDKQIRQSANFKMYNEKWSIPNMLATYLEEEERDWNTDDIETLMVTMAHCYTIMKAVSEKEWNRICKIEIPVNRILYLTQKKGIYFNIDCVEDECRKLHKEVYSLKNRIQLELEVMDSDREGYLRDKGICYSNLSNSEIEFWKRTYPELDLFLEVEKKEKNLGIMLMLAATNKGHYYCYPTFKGFGTSTGRITLRNPAIQNLSKHFRYLLEDKALPFGYRFVYVDFGQFEAGILAGLSENKTFRYLYENDKVYETLAIATKDTRESAKIDFYRFVYGGNCSEMAKPFFMKYNLIKQVDKLKEKAIENGYVETLFANRRVIASVDENENWFVNHYIQSTGSLIFKQALINVDNSLGSGVQLVLPMHDAALYIVSDIVKTETIIDEFKKAFNTWIPNVNPIVREKNFFEVED